MKERPGVLIGRIAGVPVFLAPSWFVISVVVVLIFAPQVEQAIGLGAPDSYLVAALYAVLLLLSVLVHEFAHALTARALGLPVQRIVADLWGGHTQFTDEAPTPGRAALVAIVGPVGNGLLALAGLALLGSVDSGVLRLLVLALVFSNAFVAVFNLAPGLPLDGGRVVESLVWALSGRRWMGTLSAGWCGRVLAVGVLAWGIGLPFAAGRRPTIFTAIWAVLIAALLWQGATGAIGLARLRRSAERLELAAFTEPARALDVDSDAWAVGVGSTAALQHVVGVSAEGAPLGLLSSDEARALLAAPTAPPPGTPLSAVMTVLGPTVVVPAGAPGEDVLHALAGSPARTVVVVDGGGCVVGVADVGRLAAALSGRS